MTTTPNPTAEQIVRATLLRCQFDTLGDKVADVVKDLCAHGLLSEGAPSEEGARGFRKLDQVQAILAGAQTGVADAIRELSLAAAALAAGVAPQEPRVEYLEVGHPSGERQPAYVEPTDRQKLIDEAQAFERAPKLGLSAHRELDKAILLIRRLWPALDAPLDPEKVAAIIWDLIDVSPEWQEHLTRALCEAYTEGELT